jgi:hypothetical protein
MMLVMIQRGLFQRIRDILILALRISSSRIVSFIKVRGWLTQVATLVERRNSKQATKHLFPDKWGDSSPPSGSQNDMPATWVS